MAPELFEGYDFRMFSPLAVSGSIHSTRPGPRVAGDLDGPVGAVVHDDDLLAFKTARPTRGTGAYRAGLFSPPSTPSAKDDEPPTAARRSPMRLPRCA